jgi:hypothetical protein
MKRLKQISKKGNQVVTRRLQQSKISNKLNNNSMKKLIVFLGLSLWFFTATAATLRVNKSGQGQGDWQGVFTELQDAIDAASNGDEIWVASGTYNPSGYIDQQASYLSNRDKCFNIIGVGKSNIKIYGGFNNQGNPGWADRNPATYTTTLSGSQDNCYHVVAIWESTGIVLDGFEITGGNANGSYNDYEIEIGGTTYLYDFVNNSGGGIYITSSTVELNNLDIHNNYASLRGGGIYITQGHYYDENFSNPITGSSSSIVINKTIIRENTANNGGGIYLENSWLTVDHTKIVDNNATASVGGGGGIYSVVSIFDLANVLITGNQASYGGGIYIENIPSGYNSYISSATISGNISTSNTGSEMYIDDNVSIILRIKSSIIWGYGSGVYISPYSNVIFVCASNLIQNPNVYSTTSTAPSLPYNTDPLFVNYANGNFHLQFNSPCRDMGYSNYSTATDLDGNPRVCGVKEDMGAYESCSNVTVIPDASGIVYIKKGSTGSGSSWDNAAGELSDALYTAATNTGITQIYVAEGTYTPAYAADGSSTDPSDMAFVLVNNVTIWGGFPANSNNSTTFSQRNWQAYPTILSGYLGMINNQPTYTYHVVISASADSYVNGLIIENGRASATGSINVNGCVIQRNNGGGIYVAITPSISFVAVKVQNCQASNSGGGIYNISSGITMGNVWIMNNRGSYGGGIYSENILNSTLEWKYISIIENLAYVHGGGMYNQNINKIFLNFYICGNIANVKGSAIYNNNASPEYYNTLIAQNESQYPNVDGSIFNESSSPKFYNTTISMCIPSGIAMVNTGNSSYPSLCNSIIWSDNLLQGGNQPVLEHGNNATTYHHCLIQNMQPAGNNLSGGVNPDFINFVATSTYQANYGDYHLMQSSQCIDWGDNACATAPTGDLDYKIRINNTVDLGCFEFDPANPNPVNNPYHKSIGNENIPITENMIPSNISLTVYPNPVASGYQVTAFLGEGNVYYESTVDVKVYSLEGKQIYDKAYPHGNITLELPQLSAGIYIVNVRTGEGKAYNSKLVITQ